MELKDRPVARARAGKTSAITDGSVPKYTALRRARAVAHTANVRKDGEALSHRKSGTTLTPISSAAGIMMRSRPWRSPSSPTSGVTKVRTAPAMSSAVNDSEASRPS